MTPAEIVTALVRHGTHIAVEGERVRLVFNGDAPPDDLVRAARAAKTALREFVGRAVASGAFIKCDRWDPREWAAGLVRLNPSHPPANVPPKLWLQFLADSVHFFDHGWARRAEALGWTPLDLFGCDRNKPVARVDRAGLLWLLNGRKLLAITDGQRRQTHLPPLRRRSRARLGVGDIVGGVPANLRSCRPGSVERPSVR